MIKGAEGTLNVEQGIEGPFVAEGGEGASRGIKINDVLTELPKMKEAVLVAMGLP